MWICRVTWRSQLLWNKELAKNSYCGCKDFKRIRYFFRKFFTENLVGLKKCYNFASEIVRQVVETFEKTIERLFSSVGQST